MVITWVTQPGLGSSPAQDTNTETLGKGRPRRSQIMESKVQKVVRTGLNLVEDPR